MVCTTILILLPHMAISATMVTYYVKCMGMGSHLPDISDNIKTLSWALCTFGVMHSYMLMYQALPMLYASI